MQSGLCSFSDNNGAGSLRAGLLISDSDLGTHLNYKNYINNNILKIY